MASKKRRSDYKGEEYRKAYRRAYYETHKEERLAKIRDWRDANPEKVKATQAKFRKTTKAVDARRRFAHGPEAPEHLKRELEKQDNKCGICFVSFNRSPHLDHNHTTGELRGALCGNCNRGLGYLKDSVAVLSSAIQYLEVWSVEEKARMKLLIAIPTKTEPHYAERFKACKQTWLKNVQPDDPWAFCDRGCCYPNVAYKGFTDAELGLTEINQHDNANDPIRTHRTQLMVKYAYDNGYDFVFRVDTDAYVWVDRLLESGFEKHDYMGWCLQAKETDYCINSAHGGCGFTLSRKAMEIMVNAPVEKYRDGKYWGDLWTGQQLFKHGIHCHRDTRFLDGSSHSGHHGNIAADELPLDHPYISIHPVNPIENYYAIHERFNALPAETSAPYQQIWWK